MSRTTSWTESRPTARNRVGRRGEGHVQHRQLPGTRDHLPTGQDPEGLRAPPLDPCPHRRHPEVTRTAIDPRVSERHDTMSSVPALRTTDLIGRDAELEQLTAQLGIRTSGDASGGRADGPRTAPARAVLV